MNNLTLKQLKEMKPHTIFADGITDMQYGGTIKWVAIRGGIHDWAIYYSSDMGETNEWIKDWGDKVIKEEDIKRLVSCDDEAFKMYRY